MIDWTSYLRQHLELPAMKGHHDERALREIADHLEDLYREAIAQGRTEAEAEALVAGWLGEPGNVHADLLAAEPHRGRQRIARWLEQGEDHLQARGRAGGFLADRLRELRLTLRGLLRSPFLTSVSVLVLALGIGATSAIFTLVHGILLSPLPFDDADRLVSIDHTAPAQGLDNAGQCAAWHFTYVDESRTLESVGMYGSDRPTVTGNGDPEAVPSLDVTGGVFEALRVKPVVGRLFREDDFDPDGRPTILLGEGYWHSHFGADPGVVGRSLRIDGLDREIIGVLPHRIQALGVDPAVIRPLRYRRPTLFVGNIGYGAVARLRDGVTLTQASADLTRVLPMAWKKFPGGPVADSSDPTKYRPVLRPLREALVGPVANVLWVLLAGVGVVLLIACANVANLLLVRAQGRQGEMAVRSTLGASRARLTWEYLKEGVVLALMGGIAGLVLGQLALRSLLAMAPEGLPRVEEVRLDATVALVTVVLSLACGLLVGLLPAVRQRRRDPVNALKETGRSRMRDRATRRAQAVLAVGQMALVLVLLVAGGLMTRSFLAMSRVDPGFKDPEDVLSLRLYIPRGEVRQPAEVATTYETIARSLSDLPGVSSVALATSIPMDGSVNFNPLYVEGRGVGPDAAGVSRRHKWIEPGYLETLRIPLLMGRSITWDDVHDRAPVALLSESLARQLFGSPQAALGQHIAARPDPPRWKEVVGIVADVHDDGLGRDAPALVYWPFVTLAFWEGDDASSVQVWRSAGLALRGDGTHNPDLLGSVRRAIWAVNPSLPVISARTLSQQMADSMARTRFSTTLLGLAGIVGLVLGLVGVYGVVSYAVSQRIGEIGMRMALGAEPLDVQRMVLRDGLLLAAAGVGSGLVIALGVTRTMTALLFDVSCSDPLTYCGVAGGLVATAILASYLPARRAARVDPAVALRAE